MSRPDELTSHVRIGARPTSDRGRAGPDAQARRDDRAGIRVRSVLQRKDDGADRPGLRRGHALDVALADRVPVDVEHRDLEAGDVPAAGPVLEVEVGTLGEWVVIVVQTAAADDLDDLGLRDPVRAAVRDAHEQPREQQSGGDSRHEALPCDGSPHLPLLSPRSPGEGEEAILGGGHQAPVQRRASHAVSALAPFLIGAGQAPIAVEETPVYRRPVQFRVLGPLEVDAGDGPIPLGGRKQRAVLASLLVRANQVVSTDALIEDVWGDEAPETARNILQTYVANLRKALRDDRLQGRPPGYILTVDTSELDAAHFDALVAAAKKSLPVDPNVAIATFEDALSLWRGPALADLHEHSSLLAEAARLDELRLDAQEDRIEGLLATGAPAKALSELEPLLAAQPLRESLWGLAMLAFYRAGRQADALNAFGKARELLADELGIDPSPELARLHERVLKQDPSLELRGEPLRGYRLLQKIGAGSRGTVFRGIQPHVRRDVAVKVFDERIATDPSFLERFELDAQVVASLEHPHIVPTYDYWREPGRAYLVTRYMRGGSLRALRERAGTLESEHARRIIAEIASALAFAHRQGVAHGGLRDSNVLLDAEGHAYLTDFPVGRAPANVEQDLVDLRSLSRDLLPNAVPTALARTLVDPDGTTAPEAAMAIAEAAQGMIDGPDPEVARRREERNPYKGLRAFGE